MQNCSNSFANTLGLLQFCIKSSICDTPAYVSMDSVCDIWYNPMTWLPLFLYIFVSSLVYPYDSWLLQSWLGAHHHCWDTCWIKNRSTQGKRRSLCFGIRRRLMGRAPGTFLMGLVTSGSRVSSDIPSIWFACVYPITQYDNEKVAMNSSSS